MYPFEAKRSTPSSTILILLGVLIGVLWLYRGFLFSGTLWIAGDTGDTRGFIGTLEHWMNVLRYGVSIRSEPFFYPENGVLGYNESLLLYVPFYTFFRLLHLDYFIAYQCVLISTTIIANACVHLVLNRDFGFQPWISFCCSLLFTCSAMTYLVMSHGVLLSVAVLPTILLFVFAAGRARGGGSMWQARLYMALAGLLIGLQAATCYYICWSIVFIGCLFALNLFLLLVFFDRGALRSLGSSVAAWWAEIVAGALGLVLGLIPFLFIYLPVYRNLGGGHPLEAADPFILGWRNFINVGTDNFLWGRIIQRLCDNSVEMWFGWPPVLILVACGAGLLAILQLRSNSGETSEPQRLFGAIVASGVLTWIAGYCLVARVGSIWLWRLVYRFVPGSSGIRVPQRSALVSNFFVCLAAAYFLSWVGSRPSINAARPILRVACLAGLSLFLLIEQINTTRTHRLDRAIELAKIQKIQVPPPGCGVFYVSKPAYVGQPTYATQLDAVLTAVQFRLPTVNGRGTIFPEDWNIEDPTEYNYESRANARALKTPLTGDLCALDLETGSWHRVDVLNPAHKSIYHLGTIIDFRDGGNGNQFETAGWSIPEPSGTWMVGRNASLELFLEPQPEQDLVLEATGDPFTPPMKPHHRLEVIANGSPISTLWTDASPMRIVMRIDRALLRSRSRLEIDFKNPDALLSPRQYGISDDSRHVYFSLRTLRIREANTPQVGCSASFQGWYAREKEGADWWRWSSGSAEVDFFVSQDRDITLDGAISSIQSPNTIRIVIDGHNTAQIQTPSSAPSPFQGISLHLLKGEHILKFFSTNPGIHIPTDTRPLAIALRNLRVHTPGGCEME